MITRTVQTYYEADDGTEPTIDVMISPDGPRDVRIETDLSDVPDGERAGVIARATDLYWAAERAAYLAPPQAERDGA